jgi:signal transduction histidine kinase
MPFILVTGTVSEEFAVSCLKAGADDYVLKSNLSRLPQAIIHALKQKETEEKKKLAEDELRLQNEELQRSNRELKKTNAELDNFVYSVSHNLRSPLASVLGIVNVARLESESNAVFYFNRIEESIQKLDQTIMEILDYSRNGRTDVVDEPVNIRGIFEASMEKLRYQPELAGMDIDFVIEGRAECRTDRYRLSLIFSNLLANAIKYSDPGKDQRFVRVAVSNGENLQVTVTDNGTGIRPDHLQKVFNMFFRGSEKSDGAGLGLYIAREAALKLNGTITVTSVLREGTTFHVTIPVSQQK